MCLEQHAAGDQTNQIRSMWRQPSIKAAELFGGLFWVSVRSWD